MKSPDLFTTPEVRVEGHEKVTGSAKFAGDVRMEGMLHVVFVRSPYPHARIVSVDTARAADMPGVVSIVTGSDLRPRRLGRRLQDWPVLAWETVRLVGDRVAAVVAETARQARDASSMVNVEYEVLPAVFDIGSALAPGAPVLHPDVGDYSFLGDDQRSALPHRNTQGRRVHEHGDLAGGFATSRHVFEHTFESAPVFPGHLEPRSAVVWLEGEKIRVLSTNKSPYQLRRQLSASLAIELERLVIDSGYIGGDFGGKGLSIDEFALIPLAMMTGRPVTSTERYEEDMAASSLRHGSRITLRTGVDHDGRIVAHDAKILLNGGAYAAAKPNAWLLPGDALATLAGYRVPTARVEAMTVYTNTGPAGNARAPGQPQNAFAAESHMDLIAAALDIDPFEIRVRNALQPGDLDVHGEICRDPSLSSVLAHVREVVDLDRALPDHHGLGVAVGARPSPVGDLDATATLSVSSVGSVVIETPISDQGGGAHTLMQRVVASELDLPLDRVSVRRVATDEAPFDAGIGGGRVTPVVGGAVLEGARELRRRLDLIGPDLSTDEQLSAAANQGLRVEAEFKHDAGVNTSCVYVVEVAVDPETGAIDLITCDLVADIGTVINPTAARGQLVGGFVFGLGQTLMEEMRIDEGSLVTSNLSDYKMPTMPDAPDLRVFLVDAEPGNGPFGAKSAGELANPAIGPAVANGIARAAGVRLWSLPLTSEKVLAGIDACGGRK